MIVKRTFIAALLGGTMLAGCNGSNDSSLSPESTAQSTFETPKTTGNVAELKTMLASLRQELADIDAVVKAPHIGQLEKALNELAPILERSSKNAAGFESVISRLQDLQPGLAALAARTTNSDEDRVEIASLAERVAKTLEEAGPVRDTRKRVRPDATPFLDKVKSFKGQLKSTTISLVDVNDISMLIAEAKKLGVELERGLGPEEEDLRTLAAMVEGFETTVGDIQGQKVSQSLADYVNTTRGSTGHKESPDQIARGNNFPATAMPFGFNMWTPVNHSDVDWFYNSTSNRMRAFAVTHEASGHNGNRQSLKIMPVVDENAIRTDSGSQTFQRKNEIAKAHYYGVTFDNGMKTEITPTDHAAYFRFTAPDGRDKTTLFFDDFKSGGELRIDEANGTVSGYTLHDAHQYTPRMYFFAEFDREIENSKRIDQIDSWVQFDTPAGNRVVGMRIATSFISVEQAKDNLEQEIAKKSFDQVRAEAEAAWNERLNTIHVDGATEDQKIILYSNMYRSFLYPTSAWENVRKDGKVTPTYVSPYIAQSPEGEISNKIKPGKIWVNNGFWDTYRTTWPLYTLLIPGQAREMIDGFVKGFEDGGWTTRWSNPGYADSMVGTSSDIIIADMYMKGIRNPETDEVAYQSMVRNASTVSDMSDRGRKGMHRSIFYGFMITDTDSQTVSWSLEGALNDFGLAQMARELKKDDDAAYFDNRAISYAHLFSIEQTGVWQGGWFRSKNSSGQWDDTGGEHSKGTATPAKWGYGYTEGNAWSYAFLAPQDGQGLANLYGGRDKLKAKLDAFFTAAPSTAWEYGSYGFEIHEMKEAREVAKLANVGQYQHSNQPVHHSIYMYNYAGSPASGQKYLRDVMDKLYFTGFDEDGISNGEGYIGDEDNGEQSAWYILSAMGIYPVSMGRPEYAIGAPYFPRMTVRLKTIKNGEKTLVVRAPGVSSVNRYVQSVKLNGKPVTRNFLMHSEVADGATLDFVMGDKPSQWGTGENDVPTSITKGSEKPKPLLSVLPRGNHDVTTSAMAAANAAIAKAAVPVPAAPASPAPATPAPAAPATPTPTTPAPAPAATPDQKALKDALNTASVGAKKLFDRNSATVWTSPAGEAKWIEVGKTGGTVKLYTLTSAAGDPASAPQQDPGSWKLTGSNDGTSWIVLDERKDQTFTWRQQTRPFALKTPAGYAKYRLEFEGDKALAIAEFELLGE